MASCNILCNAKNEQNDGILLSDNILILISFINKVSIHNFITRDSVNRV